jgi:hypothetical protein
MNVLSFLDVIVESSLSYRHSLELLLLILIEKYTKDLLDVSLSQYY